MISSFIALYSVCQKRIRMFAKSGIYYSCVRSNMVWLVIKTMTSNVECMTFRQMGKKKCREDSMDHCVIVKMYFFTMTITRKEINKIVQQLFGLFLKLLSRSINELIDKLVNKMQSIEGLSFPLKFIYIYANYYVIPET